MYHVSQILILSKDIPNSYIEILQNNLSYMIGIEIQNTIKDFQTHIQHSNLVIINSQYLNKVDIDCPKILVITDNKFEHSNSDINEFIFDPYKNEDRSQKDFDIASNTFLKLVKYTIEKLRIPLTPDENVHTIIELD